MKGRVYARIVRKEMEGWVLGNGRKKKKEEEEKSKDEGMRGIDRERR